jgi:methyl-accepting chemotaxis protein
MAFGTKKIGTKLLLFSIISVIIPIAILGLVSINTITVNMEDQSSNTLDSNIKTAELVIDSRITELKTIAEYASFSRDMRYNLNEKNVQNLEIYAETLKSASNADVVLFTDNNGKTIASSSGSNIFLDATVLKVSKSASKSGFEIIPNEEASKFSDSTISGVNKALTITVAYPVYDGSGTIGNVVFVDVINNDHFIVDLVKKTTGDESTIFLDKYRISTSVVSNGQRAVGTTASDGVYNEVVRQGNDYSGTAVVVGQNFLTRYESLKDSNGNTIGMLFVGTPEAPFVSLVNSARLNTIVIAIIGLLIAIGISLVSSKSITKPIKKLEEGTEKFGNGDYDHVIDVKSGDELEDLANSFNKMAENIKELYNTLDMDKVKLAGTLKEISNVMGKLSEGDFSVRADENKEQNGLQKTINHAIKNVSIMVNSLKSEIQRLNSELGEVNDGLKRAKETSEQVTDAANQVATAAADQSAKLQDIADELEKTAGAAEKVYEDAEKSVNSSIEVKENSDIGVKKVENAISTMQEITNVIENLGKAIQELGDESKKINEVTTLIKDVAEQTGLLALNASIEAARAGEAGKGFAVVASEIKSLAEEIKKSVNDINITIKGINKKIDTTIDLGLSGKDEVDKGVIAIDEVNSAFSKIRESVENAALKINAIKVNSEKASSNVEKALKNAQDIASISEEFAATAEELTASAEEQSRVMTEIDNSVDKITSISKEIALDAVKFKIK